jgi:hypothetical protein
MHIEASLDFGYSIKLQQLDGGTYFTVVDDGHAPSPPTSGIFCGSRLAIFCILDETSEAKRKWIPLNALDFAVNIIQVC